ncbi:hypothetical protein AAVH_12512 [Aphelenchoides avenae]|nr:hypothetical protein AAVH_12512 [Aphelenchus avenae]
MDVVLNNVVSLEQLDANTFIAHPKHFGGAFAQTRLFGGQSVVQAYLALRKSIPCARVVKVETNFVGPGTLDKPLRYRLVHPPKHGYCKVQSTQGERLIASCNLRYVHSFSEVLQPLSAPFPSDIGAPESYATVEELIKKFASDVSLESIERMTRNLMFEIRPEDPAFFASKSDESKQVRIWSRLRPQLAGCKIDDPMVVPILLSDYIIFHPVKVAMDRLNVGHLAHTAASLNHKIWFHHYDFNPFEFLLFENDYEVIATGTALMRGRIFDSRKRCVLSFEQESFFQSKADAKL